MRRETDSFAQVSMDGLMKMTRFMSSNASAIRVLMLMIAWMDKWNRCHNSQAEMHEKLGIHKSDISRLLKFLEDNGMIVRTGVGKKRVYHIDPSVAWKNKTELIPAANERWIRLNDRYVKQELQ